MWIPWQRRDGLCGVGRQSQMPEEVTHVPIYPCPVRRQFPGAGRQVWRRGTASGPRCSPATRLSVQAVLPGCCCLGKGGKCCSGKMPPVLGDTYQRISFGAIACSLLSSAFLLRSSWWVLYGSRSVRTCLARGDKMLQQQGQIPSCTLHWPLRPAGAAKTPGIGVNPGHARASGNRVPDPADRHFLHSTLPGPAGSCCTLTLAVASPSEGTVFSPSSLGDGSESSPAPLSCPRRRLAPVLHVLWPSPAWDFRAGGSAVTSQANALGVIRTAASPGWEEEEHLSPGLTSLPCLDKVALQKPGPESPLQPPRPCGKPTGRSAPGRDPGARGWGTRRVHMEAKHGVNRWSHWPDGKEEPEGVTG